MGTSQVSMETSQVSMETSCSKLSEVPTHLGPERAETPTLCYIHPERQKSEFQNGPQNCYIHPEKAKERVSKWSPKLLYTRKGKRGKAKSEFQNGPQNCYLPYIYKTVAKSGASLKLSEAPTHLGPEIETLDLRR